MKLKQLPEDFQVVELTDVHQTPSGAFALYQLTKRHLGTPEAIEAICKAIRIDPRRVSFGGLKDTHALTIQHLTIEQGPRRNWRGPSFELKYLYQTAEAFNSRHVTGNRFVIVQRDITTEAVEECSRNLHEVQTSGLANYFDDQRFGSVTADRQFVARLLVDGEYEGALRLALCADYPFDNIVEKQVKQRLNDHWTHWPKLLSELPIGLTKRVVQYLATHPSDYRGALRTLPHQMLTLYLAAYQSHLWNQMLAHWFDRKFPPSRLIRIKTKLAQLPMPATLSDTERDEFFASELPLPSARLKLPADSPWTEDVNWVMAQEGISLAKIQLKHWRELFFSKGGRAVWFKPRDLKWEVNPGSRLGLKNLQVFCVLPRGSYATLLMKRIAVTAQKP